MRSEFNLASLKKKMKMIFYLPLLVGVEALRNSGCVMLKILLYFLYKDLSSKIFFS